MDPFKKRNLFYSLVPFYCRLNFTAAGSIIHSHVPASLVFPMWKSLETDSPKFQIKQCQIFRRTMRTLLQDLAEKSLKGLGTKAWTNWEDRSANSLAYQVSNHSIFLCTGCLSLRSSHLMGAILNHFKGFRSASELQPDAPIADIFMTEHAWWYVFQLLSSPIARATHLYFHFGDRISTLSSVTTTLLIWALAALTLPYSDVTNNTWFCV